MDLSSLCILLLYCISFDLIGLLYNIRNDIYNISTFGILRVKKCHDSCIVHHCSVCRNQCRCQANRRLDDFFVECGEAALFWLALKSGSSPTHRKSLFRRFLPFRLLIASFFPRRKVLKWTLVRRTGHWFPETLWALEWPWSYQAAQEISWAPKKMCYMVQLSEKHATTVYTFHTGNQEGSNLRIAKTYGKNQMKCNHPFPPGPSTCWSNEWTSTALKWLLSMSAQLIFHFIFEKSYWYQSQTPISYHLSPILTQELSIAMFELEYAGTLWTKTANHKAWLHHVTHHEHADQGLCILILLSFDLFQLSYYECMTDASFPDVNKAREYQVPQRPFQAAKHGTLKCFWTAVLHESLWSWKWSLVPKKEWSIKNC